MNRWILSWNRVGGQWHQCHLPGKGGAPCLVWLGEHSLGVTLPTRPGLDLPCLGVAGPHPLWGNRILWAFRAVSESMCLCA